MKRKKKKVVHRVPIEMILRSGTFMHESKPKKLNRNACRRKGKNKPLEE